MLPFASATHHANRNGLSANDMKYTYSLDGVEFEREKSPFYMLSMGRMDFSAAASTTKMVVLLLFSIFYLLLPDVCVCVCVRISATFFYVSYEFRTDLSFYMYFIFSSYVINGMMFNWNWDLLTSYLNLIIFKCNGFHWNQLVVDLSGLLNMLLEKPELYNDRRDRWILW